MGSQEQNERAREKVIQNCQSRELTEAGRRQNCPVLDWLALRGAGGWPLAPLLHLRGSTPRRNSRERHRTR